LYRESLSLQREAYGAPNAQMATTIGNMGFIAEARQDYDEAEKLYREALAIRRALLDENHNLVTANKIKLGLFLLDHSDGYEESEQLCRTALASIQKTNPELKRLIARGHLGIGRALDRKGEVRSAERELRNAVQTFELAQPPNAKNLAEAEVFLARHLIAQKRYREAEPQLLRARNRLHAASADSSDEMKRTNESLEWLYATRRRK
jgi:tetratricopeptide (TPR) repeat protein